ncbi:MAG: Stk1 family PASTA domain-containing Ser/Thr kinase, partial [Ilumatobacteraceae bacterium]
MSTSGDATVINDRYEIHKRVGRGGMADVFLATDRLLGRQVAIKVLFPEFAVDPNFVERFRREAQAAANLNHPNIVSVFDWGKYEGTYFIAMEYIEGRTLAEILKGTKQLSSKQAAEIASEVAAALGFAHEAGLAHRDIKPANILIGFNGQVTVADFGIARAMNSATESNLTQAGSVMGTASYFSPEQAQGALPDPRSDLYSLGIVMYEMVAGKPPFTGENPVSIAYKQVHDQPTPLNRLVEGVPRPFEAIVAKLLAKDPKLRYPSAFALRDDLRRFRNGEQVQALVAAAARPSPNPDGDPPAGTPAAGAARPTGDIRTVDTAPTTVAPVTPTVPTIPGMPTTTISYRNDIDLSAYPPGASSEARYYQDNNSRTGWYALAAFVALVALVAGGVLLYQGLTRQTESTTTARTLDNYINQDLKSVTAALDVLGLAYRPIPEDNATVPENFIHRTDPSPGTVIPEGTEILLFYNPTQSLVPIPNVAGRTLEDARATLFAEGFEVDEESELSDQTPGTVIRTDPPAGTAVPQDTVITVIVSGGPDEVSIPAIIIGVPVEQARSLLESDQYRMVVTVREQVDELIPIGVVIASTPGPNNLVARGSTVELVVSSGPGQVLVPPLVGQTEASALNQLAELGLTLQRTYEELAPGDAQDGTVLSQSVPPGTEVDRGTIVAVIIGQATAPESTTTTTS